MKSLKQYLSELRIARVNMPQVSEADMDDTLKWLMAQGVSISQGNISPERLIPIQDINPKKVDALINSGNKKALKKKVLISKDNHLLDGHHRHGAAVMLDVPSINFNRVHLPVKKALAMLKKSPHAFTKR